jgi:hypothetical protein
MGLKIITEPKNEDKNFDKTDNVYKIYKITNMITDKYFISYSKQKYLSRVKEDLFRKQTKTFTTLFKDANKDDVMLELLDEVEADNIYFVKKFIEDKKFNQKIQDKFTAQTEQMEQDKGCLINECKDCDEDSISDMSDISESSYVPFEPKNDIKVVMEEVKKVDKANKPKKVYPDKTCDKCGSAYTYKNFARHYKKCEGK